MRVGVFIGAVVAGTLFLPAQAVPIEQHWPVTVGSVDGEPCQGAALRLQLQEPSGSVLSSYQVPLDLKTLGVGTSRWSLQIPRPGDYLLTTIDGGCSDGAGVEATIPVHVSESGIPSQIILLATGSEGDWRLYYFGVTRRLDGEHSLEFDEESLLIRNVSDIEIPLCRLMLGSPVREVKLVGQSWEDGRQYEYTGEEEILSKGDTVALRRGAQIITRSTKDADDSEPAPLMVRLLEVKTTPPVGTDIYLGDPPHGKSSEPFVGHCDTYVLPLFISPELE